MAILRETVEWKRERRRAPTEGPSDLTAEEQERVRVALRILRLRVGSWPAVAAELSAKTGTVKLFAEARGKPTAGIALRVARLLRAPLEDLLSGAFPKPGACPYCGREG